MASTHSTLRTLDPAAAALYRYGIRHDRLYPQDFDQGVARVDYFDPVQPQFSWKGMGDQKITPAEVFRRSLEKAALVLFEDPFLEVFHHELEYVPPLGFSDFNPATKEDEIVFGRLEEMIAAVRTEMRENGRREPSEEHLKLFLSRLIAAVQQEWSFTFDGEAPTAPSAVEMLAKPKKNCLESAALFYTIFSMAGMHPEIIEIENDPEGKSINHFVIAIPTGYPEKERSSIFYDCATGYLGAPYEDQDWHPIGLNDFVAEYLINRYYAQPFADPSEKEKRLLQAYRLAPDRFRTSYHLAKFYDERHQSAQALEFYRLAYEASRYPGLSEKIAGMEAGVPWKN